MHVSGWIARTLAACTCVGISVATAAPSLESSRSRPSVPALNWQACGEFFPGLECASATVPLDYDRPRGEQIQIALARVPASDQANKIGSVFLNPGGPGASGIDLALFGFGQALGELLDGRFDVIGFDPRGVAASEPLYCFDNADESNAFFPADLPIFPYLENDERAYFEAYRAIGPRCASRSPRILAHMSTADVARDLDLLRRAVGDSKLTYLGFSYGSYIGMTYANLFPNKVRALVIDGVLDPRLWSSGWQIATDRIAAGEELEEFLRLCDEAREQCPFWVSGGASARYEALANALRAQPVDLGGFLYSYDYLVADSSSALYSPEFWGGAGGYADLFDLIADAALAEPGAAAKAFATRQAILKRIAAAQPRRTDYANDYDAYLGNLCADIEFPRSYLAYSAIGRYAEEGSSIGAMWWWGNAACAQWRTAPDRYVGPWSTRTSNPVLVVGNHFDGVTSYAGAVGSSRLLRNSRLLSYAGWGHTAFGRSQCVTDYVLDYLRDGSLPPQGTVCAANPNPFLPQPLLRQSIQGPRLPMIGLPPVSAAMR